MGSGIRKEPDNQQNDLRPKYGVAERVHSTSAFGALKNRDFRLMWLGACLSFVGSWVQIVALGLFVYSHTHSKEFLGWVGLAGGLPTTILMLFGGVLADRANKRNLVLMTQTLFAVSAFTLAILTWTGAIHTWHIILISLANGAVFAVDGPARQAMIYDLVGKDDLAGAVALQSVAFNTARVIGPAVGSVLYAGLGPAWCFLVNGISFIAIIVAVLLIKVDSHGTAEHDNSVWAGFLEGLRYLRSNRLMRTVVSMTSVTAVFAFSAYSTLMPAFAREQLGIADTDRRYGWLFSAIGLGSLVGAYLVGKAAMAGRRGVLMVTGAGLFAVGLFGLGNVSSVWPAMSLLVLVGFAAISQLATANTLTQALAPDHLRGRAVSMHMFAMAGLQPFGALFAGQVAQRWSVPNALTLNAEIVGVFVVGVLLLRPAIARLE
jgi:MFS family permease